MAMRVLLGGATGFVGSHVLPRLVEREFEVVCATRHPDEGRKNAPDREWRQIDFGDAASVDRALEGIDAVVYLVHSMGSGDDYAKTEKKNAETLRDSAASHGVSRIVYLGGMKPQGKVSKHLESRLETGRILRSGQVPTIELQATMIVGGGSESFRIIRDLAARLPAMLLPKWLENVSEPIAIADVAAAIVHALEMPITESRVFTLPGPEVLSGREMLERTAHLLGQDPKMVEVPLVSPALSAHWIRLITRADPDVAKELVEGLRSDIVSEGETIWSDMPDFHRTSFDEGVRKALREEQEHLPFVTRVVERVLHRFAEQ